MYRVYQHFVLVSAQFSVTLRIFAFETGISFSCHVLRHTYATLLLEKGVPIEKIQYLLGHRSVNITRHYTQSAFLNVNDLEPTIL